MTCSVTASRRAILLSSATCLLVGCGGPYDATVSGTVALNSDPLPAELYRSFRKAGASAYGMIAADGKYTLRTGREEGLASGSYTATVAANEVSTATGKNGGPPPLGKTITPDWYRDPATSGLTFTVESGDNEINIELNKTPPPGWKPPPGRR